MKKKKICKVDTNSKSMKKVLQILKDTILFSKIMKPSLMYDSVVFPVNKSVIFIKTNLAN